MPTKKENNFEEILEEYLTPNGKYDSKKASKPKLVTLPVKNTLEPIPKDILQKIKKENINHQILDLHGYNKQEAFQKVQETILKAYKQNIRVLLIITGKGKNNEGVLKKLMPQYLKHDKIIPYVIGISEALPKHGGGGALYVYLRSSNV